MNRLAQSEQETRDAVDTLARLVFSNATRLDLDTLRDAVEALEVLEAEAATLEAIEGIIARRWIGPPDPAVMLRAGFREQEPRPLHCACGHVLGHPGPCGGAS